MAPRPPTAHTDVAEVPHTPFALPPKGRGLYQHQPSELHTSGVHLPEVQAACGVQSASVVQLVPQRPPVHSYGVQSDGVPATQVPLPLQAPAGVCVVPTQLSAAPQAVVLGYFWQPPAPSQAPVRPQVLAASMAHVPSLIPLDTGWHWPFDLPVMEPRHDMQLAVQA